MTPTHTPPPRPSRPPRSPRPPLPSHSPRTLHPGSEPGPADVGSIRPGSSEPFRSLDCPAEAARLLEQGLVRRVVADVLVAFDTPNSQQVRAAAAMLLLPRTTAAASWVVGFASAAWLYTGGGAVGPAAPTELHVIIPPGQRRPRGPGLRGRQVALLAQQVTSVGAVAVTEPVRTAADVARDLPAEQALIVLANLEEICGVRPHQVVTVLAAMRYARGAATARRVVRRWAEEL